MSYFYGDASCLFCILGRESCQDPRPLLSVGRWVQTWPRSGARATMPLGLRVLRRKGKQQQEEGIFCPASQHTCLLRSGRKAKYPLFAVKFNGLLRIFFFLHLWPRFALAGQRSYSGIFINRTISPPSSYSQNFFSKCKMKILSKFISLDHLWCGYIECLEIVLIHFYRMESCKYFFSDYEKLFKLQSHKEAHHLLTLNPETRTCKNLFALPCSLTFRLTD